MPYVPLADQNVQRQAYDVPVPKYATPIKEAYTGVADANVQAASDINKIATGFAEKQHQDKLWQEQADVYNSRESLSNDITDILTNSEVRKEVDAYGKEHLISEGLLNRSGDKAAGSTAEYERMASEKRNAYLDKYKNPQMKAQAARLFDSVVSSGYKQVASHEANESKKYIANSFLNDSINTTKNATQARTPEELGQSLEHITDTYTKYGAYSGHDPETITKGLEPMYSKAIQNSAMDTLRDTGSIERANMQIDAHKDLIPNDYNKIKEELVKQNDKAIAEVKKQDVMKKVSNEFNIISDIADPSAPKPTVLDVEHMSMTGAISNDFAALYAPAQKAFEERKKEVQDFYNLTPDEIRKTQATNPMDAEPPASLDLKNKESVKGFSAHMKGVMMSADKDGVTNVLKDAMRDAGSGKLSEDEWKVTVYYSMLRGNYLDLVQDEGQKKSNPELMKLDGGMQEVMNFIDKSSIKGTQPYLDFMDAIKKSATPAEASDIAKKNYVLKTDPTVATWENIPTSIKKSGLTSAISFPAGVKIRPKAFAKESSNANNP